MGIQVVHEDLMASRCEAWVNPVNTVGVLGAGLALAFKTRFPDYADDYVVACLSGGLSVGTLHAFDRGEGQSPRWIVSLPTKRHWREPSTLEIVEQGLAALRPWVLANNVSSIAIPALGCGLGGLAWDEVAPRIMAAMQWPERLGVDIRIHHPRSARCAAG